VVRDFADENVIREGSVSPKDDIDLIKMELELADLEAKPGAPKLAEKPVLLVYNITYGKDSGQDRDDELRIDAKAESELAGFSAGEQADLLKEYGLKEPGLNRLIKKAYEMLGLISFLTAGEKEVRAWTIRRGTKAVQAAGVIHSDFEKNFIKAEVVSFEDMVKHGGYRGAREAGKIRLEGRDYLVQDGDVIEFKVGI
jgi:ribosome-binding ATPase YchF (GTP1/OBG family)